MTLDDWQKCEDSELMLAEAWFKISEQQLRTFVCRCCRRIRDLLQDERSQFALETAERYTMSLASEEELLIASQNAWKAFGERSVDTFDHAAAAAYYCAAPNPTRIMATVSRVLACVNDKRLERSVQAGILREIVGAVPPFLSEK